MSNTEFIKAVLVNAPGFVETNPELQGFMIHEFNEFCCSQCAGRVMARGCWVFGGGKASPVWWDSPKPTTKCIGCE